MRELNLPKKPFGLRRDTQGDWEVFDRNTGRSVVCDGRLMSGLSLDEADMVMDVLNGDHPVVHIATLH